MEVVISGDAEFVLHIAELAKRILRVRKATSLDVSAPFHCELMHPAALVVEAELKQSKISPLRIPLISNVDGTPVSIFLTTIPNSVR